MQTTNNIIIKEFAKSERTWQLKKGTAYSTIRYSVLFASINKMMGLDYTELNE